MKRIILACASALALAAPAQATTAISFTAYGTFHNPWWDMDAPNGPVLYDYQWYGWATLTVTDDRGFFWLPCGRTKGSCGADGSGASYDINHFLEYDYSFNLVFSGNRDDPVPTNASAFVSGTLDGTLYGNAYYATFDFMTVKTWQFDGDPYDVVGFSTGRAPLPEPATWAMMIGGFALAGAALRKRRYSLALT